MHYCSQKEELECASTQPGCSVALLHPDYEANVSRFAQDFSSFESSKPSMLEKHPLTGPGQTLMTIQSKSIPEIRDKHSQNLHLTFWLWSLSCDSEVDEIQYLNGLLSDLDF